MLVGKIIASVGIFVIFIGGIVNILLDQRRGEERLPRQTGIFLGVVGTVGALIGAFIASGQL